MMAWRGERTLVPTTVAMELAVSWKPLMYSKISAMMMTAKTMVVVSMGRGRKKGGAAGVRNS
jgi:hypothetical protein